MPITYSSVTTLAHTNVDALGSDGFAGTGSFDNTSDNYDDVIVSGQIDTGGTVTAEESVIIYLVPFMVDNAGTGEFGDGVVNAGYAGSDSSLDGTTATTQDVKWENMTPAKIVTIQNTNKPHEFVFSVRGVLGYIPTSFGLVIHNDTSNALGSDHDFECTGLTFSSS